MKHNVERSMGLWQATALVLGNIVGAGMLMLPASLGAFGMMGLFGWMISAFGAVCLALVFAALSRKFPKTGGPYTYSREAFGNFVGFQMAWCYWLGAWAGNAALSISFVSYLSVFYPELQINSTLAFGASFSVLWLFTFINTAGVKDAAVTQLILTTLKIVPLVAIGIFGIPYINIDNFSVLNPSELPIISALGAAAALTLFSFMGLESATIPADNVINPKKTIPLATIMGTLFSAVIYIWTMIVLMGVMSQPELAKSTAPFAQAGEMIFGKWAGMAIAIVALISISGTLNGWILLQGQVPMAAALDNLFPKFFAKTSKSGTPVFGLVLSSTLVTILLFMNYEAGLVEQFTKIIAFTSFTILVPYLYSAVANLYFVLKDPAGKFDFACIRSIIITILGFIYALMMIMGSTQESVFLGAISIFAGVPIYVFIRQEKR